MTNNQTIKTFCYTVAVNEHTYMFDTELEARHFYKLRKLEGEKPVLSALVETTTITLTNRIIAC